MDPPGEYQLTAEEKRRKKKEKIKAKKFSDSEDISDSDVNDPPTQRAVKINEASPVDTVRCIPSSSSFREQKTNGLKSGSPLQSVTGRLGQKKPTRLSNGSRKTHQHPEIPEMVYVEEYGSTANTMKASDLLLLNSLKTIPKTTGRKLNHQTVTYSQAAIENGTTTLTPSVRMTMSTGVLLSSSSWNGVNSSDKKIQKLPPKKEVTETINNPSQVLEDLPKIQKKVEFKLNRAEVLRRCNHDVARMTGKRFLDDQVCTKTKFIKSFLKAAVRGDCEQFRKLFEMGFTHLRSMTSLNKYRNAELRRILMLRLLRIFVDQGTDSNLLMLLACCWQKTDNAEIVSCNGLESKHGYCSLIRYISSFFRPSELQGLFEVRNSYSGRTPLVVAAVAGNRCQLKALLENGADPNTVDQLGYSPIHYAIRRARQDMVLLLQHWGADIAIHMPKTVSYRSFREFVLENCPCSELSDYICNRTAALQSRFLKKIKEVMDPEKEVLQVVSDLHFTKALQLNRRRITISLNFEFDLNLPSTSLRPGQELILYIIPFRFSSKDKYSAHHDPRFEFVELKEVRTKPTAEILHDLLDGSPRFINISNFGQVMDFQHAELPKTKMTHYAFKLKQRTIPTGLIFGKLQMETKCDEREYQLFNSLLFGIQAFIVDDRKPMDVVKGQDGRSSGKKSITKREKQKREQKGAKAE